MTSARRTLIDPKTTPYYHCMARCVRRAFLCGEDHLTGKSFEHRKSWVVERLEELSSVFGIEVCAYAVMSNHYHVVLYVDSEKCSAWSTEEVLRRWVCLFSGPLLVQRFLSSLVTSKAELDRVNEFAREYRQRLQSISWFMRCLNENLARRANEEDSCKGRFWEGRFKSQALLDDAALLSCMAYVDLNPVRAGVSELPEDSDFTSLQQRINQWKRSCARATNRQPKNIKPFRIQGQRQELAIPFALVDYMELVDWSGRAIRDDKRGSIPASVPPILSRLDINPDEWLYTLRPSGFGFIRAVGRVENLLSYARKLGQQWVHGLKASDRLFAR
ncbi:transposase [Sansalvadorimonas sp. 2012CJ34-2]|uniref:Transposase n=1 Tax=Parendozoicomonas callyspongiae TaxID=2942213 RepID=A0ABT0PDJ5_9GAMM|nr:transposase [Sansalvadorimonas sp. 2012CJ34-2]MCL6269331.1 transposase [Sansalvadorimonas sp. 2012CJ34-2]